MTAPGGDCSASEGCLIQYFTVSDGISPTGAPTCFGAAGTSMETAQDLGNHQAFGHGMVNADIVLR